MKSSVIVGCQVSSQQTQAVRYVLGYQLKHLPVTYLGVPLCKRNRKACLFDSIISHLRDMLQGWALTNLSHGGRLALIRSVLQATRCICFTLASPLIRDVTEPFLFWTLGEGSVSFWHDNWLGEKPLAQHLHRDTYPMEPVSYYWHEGDWNVPQIIRTVPMPFAQTICQIPIAARRRDRIVWMGFSAGDFLMKSAWRLFDKPHLGGSY
ncbi:UNVERIFIED_CONTAM: hypothetical protein Sangu_2868700 [Sesamum angustifolium]|uniref:Uncharacterized protein n=1 Tax=Sesamum angustifolium TaxID=2727405 RepID=A0AAW2IPI8_9LAMI